MSYPFAFSSFSSGGITPAASITCPMCGNRHSRGLEVAESVAARDRQRRPSILVLSVPDVDLRALVGEKFDRSRKILVGGAVHGGFAVCVNRIDVRAVVERHLHRFDHFFFSAGIFARRARAQSGGRHQRVGAFGVFRQRICAERNQRLHVFGVGRHRREQIWRGPKLMESRVRQVGPSRHLRVDVGALGDQPLGELEAR